MVRKTELKIQLLKSRSLDLNVDRVSHVKEILISTQELIQESGRTHALSVERVSHVKEILRVT